jgi:O-antigen/teichoic acid export membrane protein
MFSKLVAYARGRFVRQLVTVSGGAMVGQALLLASTPAITRLYSPELFGLYIMLSAIATCIGAASTGRFELLLSIAEDEDVYHVIRLCVLLPLMSAALVAVPSLPASLFPAAVPWDAGLAEHALLLPALVFFSTIPVSVDFYNLREGKALLGGLGRTAQYGVQAIVQVAGGFAGAGLFGLAGGVVAAAVVRMSLFFAFMPAPLRRRVVAERWRPTRAYARTHWRYPVFSATSALIGGLGQSAIPLIVGGAGGAAAAGAFGAAMRIMNAPVRLIGNAATRVFLAEQRLSASSWKLFRTAGLLLGGVSLLIYAPLAIGGPDLFDLLLGDGWAMAGEIARAMALALMLRLVITPLSNVLNRHGGQHANLVFSVLGAILPLLACLAPILLDGDIVAAVWSYSIASAAVTAAHLVYIARFLAKGAH